MSELFVDFVSTGHHPEYLRYLLQAGVVKHFLGPRELWERAVGPDRRGDIYCSLYPEDAYGTSSERWDLLSRIAVEPNWSQITLLHFDSLRFLVARAVALDCKRPSPLLRKVGGVVFRNDFLYERRTYKRVLEKLLWRWIFLRLDIDRFRFLDIQMAASFGRPDLFLPDPIPPERVGARPSLRKCARCGDRRSVLFFGQHTIRKSTSWALEALRNYHPQLRLIVAGDLKPDPAIEQVSADPTYPHKLELHQNPSDARALELFRQSDCVALPYYNWSGSSGVLISAAAMGIPVACSDYGLMGEMVERFELGKKFPMRDCGGFRRAVSAALYHRIPDDCWQEFVDEHSVHRFVAGFRA